MIEFEGPKYAKKDNLLIKLSDDANLNHLMQYQSQSMAKFRMQKQLQGLLGISAMVLPKSPEPPIRARNEVQNMMQTELTLSTDFQTPNLIGSANGKGSQIRRSLRTIGKLINGSEKRK
ncbi:hypothetical protein CMV_017336 [Castanea mollissima]|uniref:Uncharacterized protein n=1 Tax=Castanea mollissima TaxID=60419 RepID=A0A8J4VDT9_9ROSI|nr:hypothetical protein CMV_017336 [Castanea mollissima]